MALGWNFYNLNNLGNYNNRVIVKKSNKIDKFNYLGMQRHVNNITDTLFLPLSRGIRQPALYTACIHFDTTDSTFYISKGPQTSSNFISGVSQSFTVNSLDYVDLTINENLVAKADIDPLFFAHNTSNILTYEYGEIPFPRVGSLIRGSTDLTCRVFLETGKDVTWDNIEIPTPSLWEGLSFSIEGIFQSLLDNTDTHFFTPGIPYFEQDGGHRGGSFIILTGYTYSDLLPDSSHTLWSSKIKARYQLWDFDTSTSLGDYNYSDWEASYTSGLHLSRMDNLVQNNYYRVEVGINAEIGPDNFDWEYVAVMYSGTSGDDEPEFGE